MLWPTEYARATLERCSPARRVRGCLGTAELAFLRECMASAPTRKIKPYNRELDPRLEKTGGLISTIARPILGDHAVEFGHFLIETLPYIVHTDTAAASPKNTVPYKALIFPLELSPSGVSHTVIFEQRYFGAGNAFLRGESTDALEVHGTIREYSGVHGIRAEEPFCRRTHREYLDHVDYESLAGLTVSDIFEWVPGDLLIFDRCQLHCSSSFKKFGLMSKSALVLFTVAERLSDRATLSP